MSKILVCGLINIETTVHVSQFPIEYNPIEYNFFGIDSRPSGVGLNVGLALHSLSDDVRMLSMVSDDASGNVIKSLLKSQGLSTDYLIDCQHTAQSVVLYDNCGKRKIYCDLKDYQDSLYDVDVFVTAATDCDMLCLCNINFSRNLIVIAKDFLHKKIACDVHVLSDIYDDYNRDFMRNCDILFLSNENIIGSERDFVKSLYNEYGCEIIVCGCGGSGALMYVKADDDFYFAPAVSTRPVVNTIGAGDALFSSFVHFYTKGFDPYTSLRYATVFASYKIGSNGASVGFLTENELLQLANDIY